MAFEKGNDSKLFILVIEGKDEHDNTTWREVKTYWAKKDGSKSKHLTDLIQFWAGPKPYRRSDHIPVKLSLFSVDTSNATPEDLGVA